MQLDDTLKKTTKKAKEKILVSEAPKAEPTKKARATKSSQPKSPVVTTNSVASPKHHHSAKTGKPKAGKTKAALVPEAVAPVMTVPVEDKPEHTSQDIAQLAHAFWVERNYTHGHADEDWLRAEKALAAKA